MESFHKLNVPLSQKSDGILFIQLANALKVDNIVPYSQDGAMGIQLNLRKEVMHFLWDHNKDVTVTRVAGKGFTTQKVSFVEAMKIFREWHEELTDYTNEN